MKKKAPKKLLPFLCLFIVLIVCAVVFVAINNQPEPPYHFNSSMINHITLRSGNGPVILDISEREEIDEIISLLNEFRYNEREEIPPAGGWDYGISFTAGGKDIWIVFTADNVRIYKNDGSSTIYFGPPDHFRPLVDRIDEARPR